jgi:hypothetical protein
VMPKAKSGGGGKRPSAAASPDVPSPSAKKGKVDTSGDSPKKSSLPAIPKVRISPKKDIFQKLTDHLLFAEFEDIWNDQAGPAISRDSIDHPFVYGLVKLLARFQAAEVIDQMSEETVMVEILAEVDVLFGAVSHSSDLRPTRGFCARVAMHFLASRVDSVAFTTANLIKGCEPFEKYVAACVALDLSGPLDLKFDLVYQLEVRRAIVLIVTKSAMQSESVGGLIKAIKLKIVDAENEYSDFERVPDPFLFQILRYYLMNDPFGTDYDYPGGTQPPEDDADADVSDEDETIDDLSSFGIAPAAAELKGWLFCVDGAGSADRPSRVDISVATIEICKMINPIISSVDLSCVIMTTHESFADIVYHVLSAGFLISDLQNFVFVRRRFPDEADDVWVSRWIQANSSQLIMWQQHPEKVKAGAVIFFNIAQSAKRKDPYLSLPGGAESSASDVVSLRRMEQDLDHNENFASFLSTIPTKLGRVVWDAMEDGVSLFERAMKNDDFVYYVLSPNSVSNSEQ